MSNEIVGVTSVGEICYVLIRNSAAKYFNGATFETYSAGNYSAYDVTMTEVGSTGIYQGDFPVIITAAGTYEFFLKRQQGGSPAEDDPIAGTGTVDWTGTASATPGPGSMSGSEWRDYVLRGGFKRTDKDTELFEETTDAIQEMRRRFMFDEAEIEMTTTDTITVLGDFKISVETNFGLLLGLVIEDGLIAKPLIHKSKHEFDNIYPDINVTNDRGYPTHFTIYKGEIQIGPVPDRVTYSYRKCYSTRAGTVTSATTAVPFTNLYRDILRDNVLGRLYKLLDEFDKSAVFKQSFELGFMDAIRRERKNSGEGMFNVRPYGM